jgi:lipooligosaccharide transport system ATP-binding protein
MSAGRITVGRVTEQVEALVHARALRKSYGDFEAVAGIDLDVHKGEAFGFLGPNGAGKSSTMRMIGAVSPVSSGVLRILGMDPAVDGPAIRGRLGVCPQEDTLDMELSVHENLTVYGRYFGWGGPSAASGPTSCSSSSRSPTRRRRRSRSSPAG